MEKNLFLGDEAIAQAAIDAGLSGVYAYPGTPSTEITEYIQTSPVAKERGIHSRWSVNEKTAMETALGMSYAGKRTLCCMKHVGMNVAADCFMNAAMSGIHGGMIIITADDPSMHSSQNEQDNRTFGNFAMIPMLEPSNQQEAYDMVYDGFELSEKLGYPILLRITTRMAHSRSGVVRRPMQEQKQMSFPEDGRQRFILLPALARKRFKVLLAAQETFEQESESSAYNKYFEAPNKKLGIIATGIAFNYLSENYPEGFEYPVLKISQYPLPLKQIEKLVDTCDEILVLEEGFPIVEEQLKGLLGRGLKVHGRLDGTLQRDGELSPDSVGKALGKEITSYYAIPEVVEQRPPALCQGCGHRDVYDALNEVLLEYKDAKVFSDIGCYTLGALPPFRAIDTCIDMGASITMAKGASDAGLFPAVSVIGDSTFTHSGMTGLLDCVNENSNVTIVISDNETTAMTGGQDSAGTGRIEAICEGIGVSPEHIRVVVPLKKNYEEMKQIFREEIDYKGVSVVIPRRECIQTLTRKKKAAKK
ncbi:indolepyruvate ferredoxin oxidoreductase alpha subunit [Parabacteroides sp. PF5-5]|uniref:thiamine pyrophosphate-dependent enzyme n=1 Tax=unclassified Parabacteroides TaxID=2649774 RepID=UPI0024748101|nr:MULTISPECIES: thiamine pyrophosphate-dependent enzyme [unclassified Parabacteroides]MDH6304170.1 indolepyruvate ferredoxin oxidoreductase alpha subunit [Parabacteroides sp. PH5-39]MDH6315114.1 indolepyruvate ferredoxin oxidoreductase alpha subunit [Parabacteroides sp. PF5-13]MDH6318775.1 indolepyruvate ferredoxin oxidoreductase alpha subunit [Parabacteroides sp. PH5-13]MDH6322504.1 indolepyruvate ferredoxin oxidoreductase alpha subunit [Parabacteroides sp. PH5-8]MDH6326360.1 indolepyruvate 